MSEEKKYFYQCVAFDTEITIVEGVKVLATFHRVSEEEILSHFINLKNNYQDGIVVFKKSIVQGNRMRIEIYKDGKYQSNEIVDSCTGQPLLRCC